MGMFGQLLFSHVRPDMVSPPLPSWWVLVAVGTSPASACLFSCLALSCLPRLLPTRPHLPYSAFLGQPWAPQTLQPAIIHLDTGILQQCPKLCLGLTVENLFFFFTFSPPFPFKPICQFLQRLTLPAFGCNRLPTAEPTGTKVTEVFTPARFLWKPREIQEGSLTRHYRGWDLSIHNFNTLQKVCCSKPYRGNLSCNFPPSLINVPARCCEVKQRGLADENFPQGHSVGSTTALT